MKPIVVKFKDGKYGIRRGNWFVGYEFLDMKDLRGWWTHEENIVQYCHGDEDKARKFIEALSDIGRPPANLDKILVVKKGTDARPN